MKKTKSKQIPQCPECRRRDKVVVARYGNGSSADKYWECERCNVVVKRISKFKLD